MPPLPQVCDEDGPPLPLDQQLLRPPEPRLLHQLLAAGSTGLLTCCHHLHYDHVHAAVREGECPPYPTFEHFTLMLSQMSSCSLFPSLQISFGWSTVKIDMSAVRQFQPLMPFSVPAFAATLFALGSALGTTIAVGMLFIIQVRFLSECTIYRSYCR